MKVYREDQNLEVNRIYFCCNNMAKSILFGEINLDGWTNNLLKFRADKFYLSYCPHCGSKIEELYENTINNLNTINNIINQINDIAIEYCEDYPNIESTGSIEQLYAIRSSLIGINNANKDLHKAIEILRKNCNMTKDEIAKLFDLICEEDK